MRIARELIDADADKVVRRLASHGFKAYLVGGCVRDLLLGRGPKDFDVSTSATPREIKQLFRNCRIIGRRFRLAHIFFGRKIIETSTFRANPRQGKDGTDTELLIHRDNVFGNETEDALRRDFSINGLFYDVEAETVIDHVDGLTDLHARVIRTIGEPSIRFREDPVRMMRAIKFAARLGFEIEPDTFAALRAHRAEIRKCAAPRVIEELYRLLKSGVARRSLELLVETGLAETLSERLALMYRETTTARADDEAAWAATWADDSSETESSEDGADGADGESTPTQTGKKSGEQADAAKTTLKPSTERSPNTEESEPLHIEGLEAQQISVARARGWRLLEALDTQVSSGTPASSSLVIATLCCPFVLDELLESDVRASEAAEQIDRVLLPLTESLGLTRRDCERARQILLASRRLAPSRRKRGKPMALVRRDYFADALQLYRMWGSLTGRDLRELEYWEQAAEGASVDQTDRPRRRRRRGGRRRRRSVGQDGSEQKGDGQDGSEQKASTNNREASQAAETSS